ncbi:MAG: DUF1292 domain-containing protein [Epulopiscium sp.]|nr:DUF1292 domain-containing protein [Candidatus Epulonipiscium sp.]
MEYQEFESIYFTVEDTGEEIEFVILDSTIVDGQNYILVIEAENLEDEEADVMILKETAVEDDDVIYEFLDDEEEMFMVAEKFRELSDEYDLDIDGE